MNNEILRDKIAYEFKTTFPHGWIKASTGSSLGGKQITIRFGLVGDMAQLTSKILENDPVHHLFLIFANTDKLESNCLQSGISINPPKNSYLAMGRVKTKYRRTTGDHARVLKSFNTFLVRLKQLVIDNEADIYQRGNYDDKFFS